MDNDKGITVEGHCNSVLYIQKGRGWKQGREDEQRHKIESGSESNIRNVNCEVY